MCVRWQHPIEKLFLCLCLKRVQRPKQRFALARLIKRSCVDLGKGQSLPLVVDSWWQESWPRTRDEKQPFVSVTGPISNLHRTKDNFSQSKGCAEMLPQLLCWEKFSGQWFVKKRFVFNDDENFYKILFDGRISFGWKSESGALETKGKAMPISADSLEWTRPFHHPIVGHCFVVWSWNSSVGKWSNLRLLIFVYLQKLKEEIVLVVSPMRFVCVTIDGWSDDVNLFNCLDDCALSVRFDHWWVVDDWTMICFARGSCSSFCFL